MKIFGASSSSKQTGIYKMPEFKGHSNLSDTVKLLNRIGFNNNDAKIAAKDIFKTYNNPKRGYHGINHIKNMLASFDKFLFESSQSYKIKNPDEFKFAILMHDYVNGEPYEVEKSALKAKEFLHKTSNRNSSYIEGLILATDYSKKQNQNFEQQLMQDIDIEILGKSAEEYKDYSKAIRLQYAEYPDKIYNPARIKILQTFINKDKIYNTKYYQDKYESQARENIKSEIESLTNSVK